MFREIGNMLGDLQIENNKLKTENEELKEENAKARMEICNQCSERDDYDIPCKQIRDLDYGLQLELEENEKLKQVLQEIKEIAQYDVYTSRTDLCLKLNWVKKIISECEVE